MTLPHSMEKGAVLWECPTLVIRRETTLPLRHRKIVAYTLRGLKEICKCCFCL